MIIKKFVVWDMSEAVLRAREELGPEAVLVTQRKVRQKGLKGFFLPRKLEVTMAVEQDRSRVRKNGTGDLPEKTPDLPRMPPPESLRMPLKKLEESLLDERTEYIVRKLESLEEYRIFNASVTGDPADKNRMLPIFISHYLSQELGSRQYRDFLQERAVALIGSTGVGKTTTLAKLAARAKLNYRKKVGFITIDTYRIGAVEQLKIYADIMDIPLVRVLEPEEMEGAMETLSGCDLILVDTLGTSYRNTAQLETISRYLDRIPGLKKALVLSATVDLNVFEKNLKTYGTLQYDYTILTKLDEMDNSYRLLEYLEKTGAPLSYFTAGQNVPDDLEAASGESLLSFFWEGERLP